MVKESIISFPWKKFLVNLFNKAMDTDIFSRAAQVAFYFSFSLFPLLFFLVSVFGLILESTDGFKSELFGYIQQVMPPSAFDLVHKTVEEIIESSSGGKLTIGLVITLWSASAGIDGMRSALNAVYELKETRWWWTTKLQSLGITLLLILLVAAAISLVFFGWQLAQSSIGSIGFEVTSPLVLVSIQWIAILLMMLLACEIVYNLLPNFGRFRWEWIKAGSLTAIALWLLLTRGFRLYLEYFNSYNKAYGSLGAVIILMLWLYLTAIVVMIGGAINAVLSDIRHERELVELAVEIEEETLDES